MQYDNDVERPEESSILFTDPEVVIELVGSEENQHIRKTVIAPNILGVSLDFVARFLCGREIEVLQRLEALEGVPKFIERYSPTQFAMTYISGTSLHDTKQIPSGYYAKLEELLGKIHAQGVVNLDFADNHDLLITPEGNPAIIDFAASIICDPKGGLRDRIMHPLFSYICYMNWRYLMRSKSRRAPQEMTQDQLVIANNRNLIERFGRAYRGMRKRLKY